MRSILPRVIRLLLVALSCWLSLKVNGEVAVEKSVKEKTVKFGKGYHAGHKFLKHIYKINSGVSAYQLNYRRCQDPVHKHNRPSVSRGAVDLLSGIGLQTPKGAGWYYHSFIDVVINGISLGSYQAKSVEPILEDNKGGISFLWELPDIRVKMNFFMINQQDGLYVTAEIDPKIKVKSIQVGLCCFPSITRRDGKRLVECGGQKFVQNAKKAYTFKPKANQDWLFFEDEKYDASEIRKGRGPCAVVFEKKTAEKVNLSVGTYSVGAKINYPINTRRIKLCFFEFQALANPAAKKYFLKQLPQVEKNLLSNKE